MSKYLKRIIESQLERKLKTSGAVVLAGPKFCGKTTTASLSAKSVIKLTTQDAIALARMDTRSTLQGLKPRLIDEWQTVPQLWDYVRESVDESGEFAQYILTGSATPEDKSKIFHSGAGRITPLKMKPMSLFESLDSRGTVSLKALFEGDDVKVYDENTEHTLRRIAFLLCRGGWPLSLLEDESLALEVTSNYFEGLFNFEHSENKKFRNKNPELLRMLLRSYARNISTEASASVIMQDVMQANNRASFDAKTYDEYAEVLKDLFIVEDIYSWNPNIRSKAAIRTSATRHFVDTSIACAALNISPNDLMSDLNTFGLMFEDMAVRDLSIYSMNLQGEVRHYRDSNGLECDAIIHLKDGRWAAVEIKLGGEENVNKGVENLANLKRIVAGEPPTFMMVLTAIGPAYRRPDGIYVVPINLLRD